MLAGVLRRVPRGALYGVAVLLLLATYFVHHSTFGLHFPTPWPDEGSFLWQAIAVQEHDTLFAPQLNPERTVMWMPPAYMVLQGLIFKLTGFSLQWARDLSALYLCAAFALLALLLRRLPLRFGHLVLVAVFLHSPAVLLAGNTARMESLVLLIGLAGFLVVLRGALLPGLAILALGPLAHPNGLFFGLAGVIAAAPAAWREPRRLKPSWAGLVVVVLVAICWVAYALHVAAVWDAFVSDIGKQLYMKSRIDAVTGGPLRRLLSPSLLVSNLLLLGALVVVHTRRIQTPIRPLFALAIPLQLLVCLSQGWMYDLYAAVGALLISVITVEVLTHALTRSSRLQGPRARAIVAAVVTLAVAGAGVYALRHDRVLADTLSKVKSDVGVHSGPPYFTPHDRLAIAAFLRSLESSPRLVTVQFLPWSDALLVRDLETKRVRFLQPTLYPMTSDVYLVHLSCRLPPALRDSFGFRLGVRDKVPVPLKQWRTIHERDGTERWLVYRREEAAPPTDPLVE
jgi:hypothetical protein